MRNGLRTIVGERGLSLVELLVAMAIGLIGTIIIFQVFNASEGVRRTTSSGGDAQQTGAIALYAVEHDLRQAGMGFSDPTWAGCTVYAYDNLRSPALFSFPLVPVLITPSPTADPKVPDTIAVLYGSNEVVANGVTLDGQYTSPNMVQMVYISNPWGYTQTGGDLMILITPPPTTNPCFLFESTAVDQDSGTKRWRVKHDVGGSRFNPPGGFATPSPAPAAFFTYPQTSVFYNLGNYLNTKIMPVFNTYSISGNALQYSSAFSANPNAANAVADNIVHMHADYALNDGTFKTPDATAPDWTKVVAIRVALVARSRLPEKPSTPSSTVCDTTTSFPTWSGNPSTFDLSADPNWKCYRYRVFETTVPLRNWIWHN